MFQFIRVFIYFINLAACIFKVAVSQRIKNVDSDSLSLLKTFITQKLDDAAVVLEALAIINLFSKNSPLNTSEMISICIK